MSGPERFSLKTVIAEGAGEPFEFDGPDGKPMTLPHAGVLTLDQAYRLDAGEVKEVLGEVAPKQLDTLMSLPGFAFDALVKAWLAHAGTSLGESSASSNSSKSTGRPSTRTSSRATGSRSRTSARRR